METKQINLKIAKNLLNAAKSYSEYYGYRNVQELITESMREKIFEKNEFDENFSHKEIKLIEDLLETSIKKNLLSTEEEMNKILLK